ncbi:MAG: hypothetical protein K8R69_08145 [Deltaproteobacteria bacterium]|nr:hypothetical protein [Deltaproteobacteria bacterium]
MEISLRTPLNGVLRHEWEVLTRERDPQLLAEGLLGFAQREEQLGRLDLAAEVYSLAAENEADSTVRNRARTRLDAILGRGSVGPRAEFLLRQFAGQASEPSALLAMGVAGPVFRLTRLAALSRLAAAPTANFLTRGFGARALASLAGFALEAPTFTLVGRLGSQALGRPQDWSGSALSRDLASSYLVLGAMKFAGWASGAAYQRFGAGGVHEGSLRTLTQQGGMFTGILLGHALESRAGLRTPQAGETLLTDSLAMLLQFHVAGRLSSQALGPRVQAWEHSLELRSERLRAPLPHNSPGNFPTTLRPALALAGGREVSRPGVSEPVKPEILMMTQDGEGNGKEGTGSGSRRSRPTLLGLGRDSKPPAPLAPYYSEVPNFGVSDLSPHARYFSIESLPRPGQDYLSRVIDGLDLYFTHYRDPVVVTYAGFKEFDSSLQGVLKLELHRLFREHSVPNDTAVTVLSPYDGRAYHFIRQKMGFSVQVASLEAAERRSSLPEAPAVSTPPSAVSKSGILARPPTVPPRPSPPRTPPLPAAGSDRFDMANAEDFSAVKVAFGRFLGTMEGMGLRGPAIRMTRGRVEEKGLQELADILGEHPLPVGNKLTILWMEKGGGSLAFQWQGDLIRAEWKGFQVPAEAFWLAPVQSRMGHFQVFRASQLPSYAFEGFRNYETAVESQLQGLFGRLALPGRFEDAAGRSDGAARRGEVLSRLAMHWLKENKSTGRTLAESAQRDFIEIHRLLERAYACLDLGTPRRFSERMGREKLRSYAEAVEAMNRPLSTSGSNLLLPLEDFSLGLPGEAALPLNDTLLAVFSDQMLKANGGVRIRSIRDLYSQVFAATRTLSPEIRRTRRLEDLPTLSQIDTLSRGSRP